MSTLIVYASKYGSTEKCAKLIAAEIKEEVELINLKEVKVIKLSNYNKVIIGGSIYIGKIQKEVTEFCTKNLEELKFKKIGLFICGMVEGEGINNELNKNFPSELIGIAVAKEYLGGEFLIDKMSFMDKIIVKKVSMVTSNKSNIFEDKIHEFAEAMKTA